MKKWISLCLFLAVFFCGCGGGGAADSAQSIDPNALAKTLVDTLSFDEAPGEIAAEDISLYMDVPDGAEGAFYKSGSTTEAVAVFSCADDSVAGEINASLENYLSEQETLFEAYDAKEVERIQNAYLKQHGNVVVMCVCADASAASDIVEKEIK